MLRRFEAEQEEVPGDRSKDSKKFFANIIKHPRNSGKKKNNKFFPSESKRDAVKKIRKGMTESGKNERRLSNYPKKEAFKILDYWARKLLK